MIFRVEYACFFPVFCYNIVKQEREGFNQLKTSQKLPKGEQQSKQFKPLTNRKHYYEKHQNHYSH